MTNVNIDNSVLVSQYLEVSHQIEELHEQLNQLVVTQNELIAQVECRTGYQTYRRKAETYTE